MIILLVFGMIFVSFFLYTTIRTLRRLQEQVQDIQEELEHVKGMNTWAAQCPVPPPRPPVPTPPPTVPSEPVEEDVDVRQLNELVDNVERMTENEAAVEMEEVKPATTEEADMVNGPGEEVVDVDISNLSGMKVEELREVCKKMELNTKGTKQELLQRIQEFVEVDNKK
jgi:hypothetical protein